MLTDFIAELVECPIKVERWSLSARSAHHAEAEDIISLSNRVGWFVTKKISPVFVELRNFWDKRHSTYKVKRHTSRVFLVADKPIDMQCKSTLTRLKTRVDRDGKLVVFRNVVSHNFRGFNNSKLFYMNDSLQIFKFLFLQAHCLSYIHIDSSSN